MLSLSVLEELPLTIKTDWQQIGRSDILVLGEHLRVRFSESRFNKKFILAIFGKP